jgi:LPS-assembly lipoprotein
MKAAVRAVLFVLFIVPMLGACGFQPLYGSDGGTRNLPADLAGIQVGEIPDRLGQQIRNHLLDQLNPEGEPGAPNYRLEVKLDLHRQGLGYRRDESITRVNLRLTANYVLRDTTDKVILSGAGKSIASFDVVQKDFSTLTAVRDGEERMATDVANQIVLQLAAHFQEYGTRYSTSSGQ